MHKFEFAPTLILLGHGTSKMTFRPGEVNLGWAFPVTCPD
jgi:hypothetical protein